MAGPFASSTFSTGAKDTYRAVDVYSQSGGAPITSYQEKTGDTSSLMGLFGSGKDASYNALSLAKNTVAYGKGVTVGNGTKDSLDRAIGGLGAIGSGLRGGASAGLLGTLMSNIGPSQNIYATVGNTVSRLKSGQLPDIRTVTDLINKASGAATGSPLINITDTNSIVGMTAGLVTQATQYGIPNSFSQLTKNLTNNPTILAGVIDKALPYVTKMGDVGTLKEMALADAGMVKMSNPNILGDFSFNYRTEEGTTGVAQVAAFSNIKETFTAVDPMWDKATTKVNVDGVLSDVVRPNISTMATASSDFKRLFKQGALQSNVPEDKLFLLADLAPAADVRSQLMTNFPETTIASTPPSAPIVVSPADATKPVSKIEYDEPYKLSGTAPHTIKTTYGDGSWMTETSHTKPTGQTLTIYTTFDTNGVQIKRVVL